MTRLGTRARVGWAECAEEDPACIAAIDSGMLAVHPGVKKWNSLSSEISLLVKKGRRNFVSLFIFIVKILEIKIISNY